ncbi:MAG: hypothetical protein K6E29_09540 [Cyanobacteria bacterium RUI128]|nr:hypothetical protein [Cyanobacteria bacterium RUI128]
MGLSSSQARLLNLTARMHQIEYKAAKLEAQKLQMANESRRVYDEYLDALEQTKVQVKTLNTDGSASYKDINSYQDFINAGYAIQCDGVVYNGTLYDGLDLLTDAERYKNTPENITWFESQGYINSVSGATDYFYAFTCGNKYIANNLPGFTCLTLGDLLHNKFGIDEVPRGSEFENLITNLINSGEVTIVKLKDNSETSVAIDTGLQEVSDESLLRKAEAKYEADMRKIDAKDRKYDTDLAALDAERNAIKSEMETLKTVAKDNVERTFKLFS